MVDVKFHQMVGTEMHGKSLELVLLTISCVAFQKGLSYKSNRLHSNDLDVM